MNSSRFDTLINQEDRIIATIRNYKLDHILYTIFLNQEKYPAFVLLGIGSFAIRFCNPSKKEKQHRVIKDDHFNHLVQLLTQYLINDPLGSDGYDPNENISHALLRIVGNQNQLNFRIYGMHARAIKLFHEIPKKIQNREDIKHFDIATSFERLNQASFLDFINVSFVAYAAATSKNGGGAFVRSYFDKASDVGISLPNDKTRKRILGQITSYPKKFNDTYEHFKNKNREFSIYDFNPLFVFPLIRPWPKTSKVISAGNDRIMAPIPKLIAYRATTGIYYQLFNQYKTEFSNYFGYIFEYYIGEILKNSVKQNELYSETQLKSKFTNYKGKIPDWAVYQDSSLILFECKAAKLNRVAIATGSEDSIDKSFKQIKKAFKQINEFKEAIEELPEATEIFGNTISVTCVIVTLEQFLMVDSELNRPYFEKFFQKEKIDIGNWFILPMDKLEVLQPYVSSEFSLSNALQKLKETPIYELQEELELKTGKTHRDSFLDQTFENMMNEMKKKVTQ